MIPEYVAFMAARQRAEWHARSAQPAAPVQSEQLAGEQGERFAALRALLCAELRRLADRIDPAAARPYAAPLAHRR